MVIFVAVLEKVLLTLVPKVVIAAIETTMIRATIDCVFNRSGPIFILQERTKFVSNKVHLRLICKVFEQIKTESAKSTHRFIIIGK